jgi:chemotaxis signal transduction protein
MNDTAQKQLSLTGRRHALMKARARRLARPRITVSKVETVACLVCEAGEQLYALPLARVTRVAPATRLAAVPTRNRALIGVTGRSGVFYNVYDLAALVGGASAAGAHLVMLRGSPPVALQVQTALRVTDLVPLDAAEAANLRASHPAIAGFARAAQDNLFDERTISLIDTDMLASTLGRARGDQA